MGEKVGFTNRVFEKLCFPENTIFIVFSAKHSFSKTKTVCWKNRKFMKNSGLFLNMANGDFWVWFFWGFNFKKVCFWCVWHCFKSVKNACFFPSFLGFSGVAYYCSSGFGRCRCYCVSCVCFSLFVLLLFLFCLLCYWFCGCFVFCFVFLFCFFCFCFFFFVFLFCFFWGFKGQVRWPKGPPHLALNPPYCLVFVFCLLFFCFFVWLFFVSVFLGGFKGQVRWPKGPPHLALNPPYLFFCFLFFLFFLLPCLYLLLIGKHSFPPKKGNFCLFICVFLCFSLALFWASPFFPFLFICPSLVSFFLPSFLVFHLSFRFFLFLFVWFALGSRCCFSFSACCLLLFWIIMFDLCLLCILFSSSCCFWFCCFHIL